MKLRTLIHIYDSLNSSVFAGVLSRPRFLATRSDREYGAYEWIDRGSIIHFAAHHIPGALAKAIVYHEMIHQYVEEYLGIDEGSDHHGPEFWRNYRLFNPGVELSEEF